MPKGKGKNPCQKLKKRTINGFQVVLQDNQDKKPICAERIRSISGKSFDPLSRNAFASNCKT